MDACIPSTSSKDLARSDDDTDFDEKSGEDGSYSAPPVKKMKRNPETEFTFEQTIFLIGRGKLKGKRKWHEIREEMLVEFPGLEKSTKHITTKFYNLKTHLNGLRKLNKLPGKGTVTWAYYNAMFQTDSDEQKETSKNMDIQALQGLFKSTSPQKSVGHEEDDKVMYAGRRRNKKYSLEQSLFIIRTRHSKANEPDVWLKIHSEFQKRFPLVGRTPEGIKYRYTRLRSEYRSVLKGGKIPSSGSRAASYYEAFKEGGHVSISGYESEPTSGSDDEEDWDNDRDSEELQEHPEADVVGGESESVSSHTTSGGTEVVNEIVVGYSGCVAESDDSSDEDVGLENEDEEDTVYVLPAGVELLPEDWIKLKQFSRRSGIPIQAFLDDLTPELCKKTEQDML